MTYFSIICAIDFCFEIDEEIECPILVAIQSPSEPLRSPALPGIT
jgi:hypothetical protein